MHFFTIAFFIIISLCISCCKDKTTGDSHVGVADRYKEYDTFASFDEWSLQGIKKGTGLSTEFVYVKNKKDTIRVVKSIEPSLERIYINRGRYWSCHFEYNMLELIRGESYYYKCENNHVTRTYDRFFFADSMVEYVYNYINIDGNNTVAELCATHKITIKREEPNIIHYEGLSLIGDSSYKLPIKELRVALSHDQAINRYYMGNKSNIKLLPRKIIPIEESNNFFIWKWRRHECDSLPITNTGLYRLTPYYEVLYETVLDRIGYEPC